MERKRRTKLDSVARVRARRRMGGARRAAPRRDPEVARRVERLRVPAKDLTWACNSRSLPFRTTRDLPPLRGVLGQRRALETLAMGLKLRSPGYNVFVCGLGGAESLDVLEGAIRELRPPAVEMGDLCYVHDFRDPRHPRLLQLQRGQGPRLEQAVRASLERLRQTLAKHKESQWRARASAILDERVPRILAQFPQDDIRSWLSEWRRHLLAHLHHAALEDYHVNCLRTSSDRKPPVVRETLPSWGNLFGAVGRRAVGDHPPAPHFTEITGGSLVEACGGVLILSASDFRGSPGVWATLKSCLKYGTLQIEDGDPTTGSRASGLKPAPVPLDVKVVLVGDYALYDDLFDSEPDFRDIFKIRVDFDTEVPLTTRVLRREYPAFVARTCEAARLRPVTAAGVAKVMEFAVRKAGRKSKISTQSWIVADLLREADYWAGTAGRRRITDVDVERAVGEGIRRVNLVETKIGEMISEGTILIATSGERIGQVNGLAVYDLGDYLFAKPSRITAQTSVGHSGIINIEREVGFSGRSHDKGVQIIAGYLRERFAQRRPLSLTASVCFEQSYSGVDGDSASATEVYAILSSLSGLPIRQDIAVTGSLNQKGDVQPIGGVNEKIEGFYDSLRGGRRTGKEGVIVPRKNVGDLMLRADIVAAVKRGRFSIYAIDRIEQGIEILTGAPVGRRLKSGSYTKGSVFHRVDSRLEEIAHGLRKFHESSEAPDG
jgi:predicted ATP-dependent protease